jgi:hypothetical protein
MIEVQSTLNGETKKIQADKCYMVDFSRLQSVNDLMVVLSGLGITYPGNHPLIEHLKPFLNLENPIDIPQQQQRQSVPQQQKANFIPLRKTDLEKRIFDKKK